MRAQSLAIAALLASAGVSAVAQSVDGLDIAAIRDRLSGDQADAQVFADHVKNRGDAFRDEALAVRDRGAETMRRIASRDLPRGPSGVIDFDEIVAGAAANAAERRGQAPRFIVFASLSMPETALISLVADTARAGGVVVFRGFPGNSAGAFTRAIARIVGRGDVASIGIDPRLFRAFQVRVVPTYVAVGSDFDLCDGFACQTGVPPHDRMTGNVTVRYALATFAESEGPGAKVAEIALRNLAEHGGR